jgi:hypothetical protein
MSCAVHSVVTPWKVRRPVTRHEPARVITSFSSSLAGAKADVRVTPSDENVPTAR